MTIGEKIKRLRKEKGLTQLELAKKSGISAYSIILYEKDENDEKSRKPRTGQIQKIANALEVSPADIIGWEYYDKIIDTEQLANTVMEISSFESYLSNIGYMVRISPDGKRFITKDDETGEFEQSEYDELQAKFIELRKKVEELQDDNQAIIEARIRKKARK